MCGNNELLYGDKTTSSVLSVDCQLRRASYASRASRASCASCASDASHASHASDASRASDASHASRASCASDASHASRASDASRASYASHASRASDAGVVQTKGEHESWFTVPSAIGTLPGLEHPPVFKKNKYGIAGHWKINTDLVNMSTLGWIDPFMGWGESPLLAKKMGKRFCGIEINPDSMNGYILPYIQKAVGNDSIKIILGDSAVFRPELVNSFDLCYTSPPYYDFEDYGFHNKEIVKSSNYDEYHERVTIPVFTNMFKYLVDDSILALQTEKDPKCKKLWVKYINKVGFRLCTNTTTGQEKNKYSSLSKRDQTLLIFVK